MKAKAWKHFCTITRHRHQVIRNCYHAGILWQGLRHDLSKYSPTEFIPGAKYYQGDRSPNAEEREVNGFLGAHATSLTVIPEGDDRHEFLGFIMPRTDQYSANRSYFSWLCGNKEYTLDARIKGGERHMIMSGEYDKVFPMSIFPEYLIKAIIAGDIDRMEALGIYEVAPEDFAVCEFVDSSKLELQRIVRQGLDMLRKEMC